MTGRTSRFKGRRGEREFLNKLGALIGRDDLYRNLDQWFRGGCDCVSLENWAIEIKRQETLALGQWWQQATGQAEAVDRRPALAYRQSRKPWRVMVPMSAISPELPAAETAELSLEGFAALIQSKGIPVGTPCQYQLLGVWCDGIFAGLDDSSPQCPPRYRVQIPDTDCVGSVAAMHFRLPGQAALMAEKEAAIAP